MTGTCLLVIYSPACVPNLDQVTVKIIITILMTLHKSKAHTRRFQSAVQYCTLISCIHITLNVMLAAQVVKTRLASGEKDLPPHWVKYGDLIVYFGSLPIIV